MAGLLKRIAKQLSNGGNEKISNSANAAVQRLTAKNTSEKDTTVPVKNIKTNANEWVMNSTIVEPRETKVEIMLPEEVQEEMERELVVTAIDRTVKHGKVHTDTENDDYLLTQIDEFREKAQQLQDLLLSKESKVMELQTIVDEREGKAKELEDILNERQSKADGITAEVEKQIDHLIEKVSEKMEEIGESIGTDLENGQKLSEQQMQELKAALEALHAQLETMKTELSDKVHSENVKCFRNITDLFKSMEEKLDKIEKVNDIEQKVQSVHKCTIAMIVLTAINMLGLTLLALFELGVFWF